MTDDTLDGWLENELTSAEAAAHESHSLAMNSYGAGDDAGYVRALRAVREKMTELGWPTATNHPSRGEG